MCICMMVWDVIALVVLRVNSSKVRWAQVNSGLSGFVGAGISGFD